MNNDIALASIDKLVAVARSAAFMLFALAPSVLLVASIDLIDVLASNKTGLHLFIAVAAQWLFAIAVPGLMVAAGLRLSLASSSLARLATRARTT